VTGSGSQPAYIFTPGDIVMNARTGERMLVSAYTGTTQIRILTGGRSFGATAAAAGADSDSIFIIGNVNEEGSGARNINVTKSSKQSNVCQIFKKTIGATGTEIASKLYGGGDLDWQQKKAVVEHPKDIERAFWWGEKNDTATGTNGKPMRATGGILEFITGSNAYVQDQGGVLTAPDMNTFLREGMGYGETKMLFSGGKVIQAINEIARGQLQTKVGDSTYGVKISEWITAWGTVNVVYHPLFVQDYAGYAFLLDLTSFRHRYMEGRNTQLKTNIQAPDVDGECDQLITECGLERKLAAQNALLKNVED
jgi:hypothetical protein